MASLYDLPDEIILYICFFLPSREVIATLPRVSHRLYDMLSVDWYWRSRYSKLLNGAGRQTLVLGGRKMWQLGCIQAEVMLAASKDPAHRLLKGVDC